MNPQNRNVLILLLLAYISAVYSAQLCEGENWIAYKEVKCFKIVNDTTRTFDDAEKYCEDKAGGILASIEDEDQQKFIEKILFEDSDTPNDVWIGLKKFFKFQWIDNSTSTYQNWESGHPDLEKPNRNCTQMTQESEHEGKWVDVLCNKNNIAVCQKSSDLSIDYINKTVTSARQLFSKLREEFLQKNLEAFIEEQSSDRWMYFKIFNETINKKNVWKLLMIPKKNGLSLQNFAQSIAICQKYSGSLVGVSTWHKQMVLNSFFYNLRFILQNDSQFWLNGQKNEGILQWRNSEAANIVNWYGAPNTTRLYVGIQLSEGENYGKWVDANEADTKHVICELPLYI